MSEPTRFFSLPPELRIIIWNYALPDRIIEFGEPCDPDILPERDLRNAWKLNRKQPTIAHLCHESREIAMRVIRVQASVDPDCMRDDRPWFKYSKTIHFNSPDYELMNKLEQFSFEDNLIGSYEAGEMDKHLSISADLIHPFLRFHDICGIHDLVVWHLFGKLKSCIIALQTVCIRATKQQVRDSGLFDLGEEPAQLIDPFNKETLRQYKVLWSHTRDMDKDISANKFFDTVETPRFNFRVERWLAEMEAMYIRTKWISPPFLIPPPSVVIAMLCHDPRHRHTPEVLQYLEEFPKLDLRIMFRLCLVDPVIT